MTKSQKDSLSLKLKFVNLYNTLIILCEGNYLVIRFKDYFLLHSNCILLTAHSHLRT
jgi:hypothetical protein